MDGKSMGSGHGNSFSNGPQAALKDWRLRELNATQVTFWPLV